MQNCVVNSFHSHLVLFSHSDFLLRVPWRCGDCCLHWGKQTNKPLSPYMSRIANNALLGGGVRVRLWIRNQRKIKRRSKALLSLCWQSWTPLVSYKCLNSYSTNHKVWLHFTYVTCTSSHREKLWPSRLHRKEVVGPELANSTVAVSPFTVTPSLIRRTVHILGFAV